jgi:hypothetical protein|tara:strand:+ start:512 stop:688 length:177 start_codon:yes stop_codon:yes gene_type:complete
MNTTNTPSVQVVSDKTGFAILQRYEHKNTSVLIAPNNAREVLAKLTAYVASIDKGLTK